MDINAIHRTKITADIISSYAHYNLCCDMDRKDVKLALDMIQQSSLKPSDVVEMMIRLRDQEAVAAGHYGLDLCIFSEEYK